MNKRLSITVLLACFILISTIGMGFTSSKAKDIDTKDANTYILYEDLVEYKEKETIDLIDMLEKRIDIELTAYVLMAGDKKVGTLKRFGEIEEILEELKVEFTDNEDENITVKNIEILEELDILKEDVHLEEIEEKEEVIGYIKSGGEEINTHKIEVGESFSTISEIYDMNIDDLVFLNPDKDGENLDIGEEITIKTKKPLMTVAIEEEIETTRNISFELEIKEDPDIYDTKTEVEVEGQVGQEKTIVKEIKHNDKLVTSEILSKETIKEPVNKVIVKGTKKTPKNEPTGGFLMPTRGRISSTFGSRWGRMHRGIDIAKASGSDILASDGGKISFSGVMGTYGNLIEIDHGNGYKTRYAHCSKLLVGVGQRVSKGQLIAKVGNTGRSTGPHLHFEVIKNGVNQNPSKYVK